MDCVELALKLDRILCEVDDEKIRRQAIEFVWFYHNGRFTDWSLVRIPKAAHRKGTRNPGRPAASGRQYATSNTALDTEGRARQDEASLTSGREGEGR